MRKMFIVAALTALALPSLAGDHDAMKAESGWFDMENCAMCRNLMEDPGLLPHTTWEGHPLADGMMYIMTVAPEYAESMAKAGAAMAQVGADLQSGKLNPMTTPMCGHCKAVGMIMMAGVEMEHVKGDAAEVSIYTSDDEALVKKMHGLVERDKKEMAMMSGDGQGSEGHEGHGHH